MPPNSIPGPGCNPGLTQDTKWRAWAGADHGLPGAARPLKARSRVLHWLPAGPRRRSALQLRHSSLCRPEDGTLAAWPAASHLEKSCSAGRISKAPWFKPVLSSFSVAGHYPESYSLLPSWDWHLSRKREKCSRGHPCGADSGQTSATRRDGPQASGAHTSRPDGPPGGLSFMLLCWDQEVSGD